MSLASVGGMAVLYSCELRGFRRFLKISSLIELTAAFAHLLSQLCVTQVTQSSSVSGCGSVSSIAQCGSRAGRL